MPEVDIPTPTGTGGGSSGGSFSLDKVPTMVKIAAVGALAGLAVFVYRKATTGSGTGSASSGTGTDPSSSQGTLLPNTAIMLGSLQESMLNLQGDVTTGNADLGNQLTGVGSTLSAAIDTQSAATQQSFSDLGNMLGANFATLQGSENAISQAIAGLGTQNAGLSSSLQGVLTDLQNIGTNTTSISSNINNMLANQSAQQSSLNQLGAAQQAQQAYLVGMQAGLGGSIGTTKGELGALAAAMSPSDYQAVKSYLISHGDYTLGTA